MQSIVSSEAFTLSRWGGDATARVTVSLSQQAQHIMVHKYVTVTGVGHAVNRCNPLVTTCVNNPVNIKSLALTSILRT